MHIKKIVLLLIVIIFSFSLFGCKKEKQEKVENQKYTEKDCTSFNEKFDVKFIYDANKLDNGNVVILAENNKSEVKRYTTKDCDIWKEEDINLNVEYDSVYDMCISNKGDIIVTYSKDESQINSFCSIDDRIIFFANDNEIRTYDLNSGKEINKTGISSDIDCYYQLYGESSDIYFIGNEGVASYDIENNKYHKIIEGTESTFGDNNYSPEIFCKKYDKSFLGIFYYANSAKWVVKEYEINNKKKEKLIVYSLYENEILKQNISYYNRKNSDIVLSYEVGIKNVGEKTETDEIKKLNNDIMTGNGPDILILDDLPNDSYMDKGLLANFNDIVSLQDEDLFDNIVSNYLTEDSLYSIPLRFKVPMVCGKDANKVTDIKSFAVEVDALSKEDDKKILDVYEPSNVIKMLYNSGTINWINEDKTVNKEEIRSFINSCKMIYEACKDNKKSKDYDYYLKSKESSDGVESFERYSYLYKSLEATKMLYQKIEYGNLDYLNNLVYIISICNQKDGYSYKNLSNEEGGIYIPELLMGINSKSNKVEKSKQVINDFLKIEYQEIQEYEGLPINKQAFMNRLSNSIKEINGSSIETDNDKVIFYSPTSEEQANFINIIEKVNIPTKNDTILLNQVEKDIEKYIDGKSDIDTATNNVISKMELYISEK